MKLYLTGHYYNKGSYTPLDFFSEISTLILTLILFKSNNDVIRNMEGKGLTQVRIAFHFQECLALS